eukprot:6179686-Pleurochrysis_carterae.AAC.1
MLSEEECQVSCCAERVTCSRAVACVIAKQEISRCTCARGRRQAVVGGGGEVERGYASKGEWIRIEMRGVQIEERGSGDARVDVCILKSALDRQSDGKATKWRWRRCFLRWAQQDR